MRRERLRPTWLGIIKDPWWALKPFTIWSQLRGEQLPSFRLQQRRVQRHARRSGRLERLLVSGPGEELLRNRYLRNPPAGLQHHILPLNETIPDRSRLLWRDRC